MDKGKKPIGANKQTQQLITALGGMSEMAHTVYNSMIQSGASRREAEVAMTAWIGAFWHESMTDARRNQQMEEADDGEA